MTSLLAQLTEWSGALAGLLWGNGLTLLILLGMGLYLTLRMGLVQIRGFRHSIALISGTYSCPDHEGQISHFQALSTALSATIGTLTGWPRCTVLDVGNRFLWHGHEIHREHAGTEIQAGR